MSEQLTNNPTRLQWMERYAPVLAAVVFCWLFLGERTDHRKDSKDWDAERSALYERVGAAEAKVALQDREDSIRQAAHVLKPGIDSGTSWDIQ